jgi:hypothetical protein
MGKQSFNYQLRKMRMYENGADVNNHAIRTIEAKIGDDFLPRYRKFNKGDSND